MTARKSGITAGRGYFKGLPLFNLGVWPYAPTSTISFCKQFIKTVDFFLHQRKGLFVGATGRSPLIYSPRMVINYRSLPKHSALSLAEERKLIAQAKKGCKAETDELILRHIGFINFRLHRRVFPAYVDRFGEDILSEAVFILYDKIKSYDLRYRDKNGDLKPVKFSSYIWKRIDGFILDSLKKELQREHCQASPDW